MPRPDAGLVDLLVWGAALSIAWTATQIPYGAWGAELSRSYAGRNRVTAFREAFTVVGTLIALAAPAVLPAFGVEGERAVLASFAVALAVLLPMTVLLLVTAVPEPKVRSRVQLDWKQGVAHMAANAPFRRLLSAFLVNGLANGLPATLFLFFVQSRLASPDAAGPLLVLYFVCGIAGVPLWLWLARRFSKHRAWALGMILACAAFAFAPFLGPGDVIAFGAVVVVTGFALGADVVLPASMQADVIEVDAAISGRGARRALPLGLGASHQACPCRSGGHRLPDPRRRRVRSGCGARHGHGAHRARLALCGTSGAAEGSGPSPSSGHSRSTRQRRTMRGGQSRHGGNQE